jgi:hypothetical protein
MEIYKDLRITIEKYFDKKLNEVNVPEALDSELWNMVEDLIDNVQEQVGKVENEIDMSIEDFDYKQEIQNIRDDIRTQDYLERDLFKEAV